MKIFSERAKHRLKIAARFLRQRGITFPKTGDFYGAVLESLRQHPDHERIREWVDWVEAYELEEKRSAAPAADKTGLQRAASPHCASRRRQN